MLTPNTRNRLVCETSSAWRPRENARRFLVVLLDDGPLDAKDVYEVAKEIGIARNTLHRAKRELGVEVKKDGRGTAGGAKHRAWRWHLPTAAVFRATRWVTRPSERGGAP
jgi:hypothetical protein